MALDGQEAEIAETLYWVWFADKRVKCSKRQLCRMAEALCALGEGIKSELTGEVGRSIINRVEGQKFNIKPANQEIGRGETRVLPTADELISLLRDYRQACEDLKRSQGEVEGL